MRPSTLTAALALASTACLSTAAWAWGENWQFCADENSYCRTPQGQAAQVRYGTQGQYEYRDVNGGVPCNNRTFGDPAPGQAKRCEVLVQGMGGGAPDSIDNAGWTSCAPEGAICRVPGSRRVRFGANGVYAYRMGSGAVGCDVRTFGDPTPGVRKVCQYEAAASNGTPYGNDSAYGEAWPSRGRWPQGQGGGWGQPAYPGQGYPEQGYPTDPSSREPGLGDMRGWRVCATENQWCSFSGVREVRYGADMQFVAVRARNGMQCSNEAFGTDPLPGVPKACFVRR